MSVAVHQLSIFGSMRHKSILVLSFLIFLSLSFLVKAQRKDERLHPYVYLIPRGYVGWIRIDFNVKDAHPLKVEANYYVIKIDLTGHFQTSTEDAYGPLGDVYLYECGNQRERLAIS